MVSRLPGTHRGCVSSALLFKIFGTALVDVIVQRFTVDPAIVRELVYPDDEPKMTKVKFRKSRCWRRYGVRCGLCFIRMRPECFSLDVPRRACQKCGGDSGVACQEFSLTVSERNIEPMRLYSAPESAETALHIGAASQRFQQLAKIVYFDGAFNTDAKIST